MSWNDHKKSCASSFPDYDDEAFRVLNKCNFVVGQKSSKFEASASFRDCSGHHILLLLLLLLIIHSPLEVGLMYRHEM
jgi:hypothetical protein